MDEILIHKWNQVVGVDDEVIVVGDFAFASRRRAQEICQRLNGSKTIILGNHDRSRTAMLEIGFKVAEYHMLYQMPNGIECNISHYPYRGKEDDRHKQRKFENEIDDDGKVLLHGHVHTAWKVRGRMINVGVDVWGYAPVPVEIISDLALEVLKNENYFV